MNRYFVERLEKILADMNNNGGFYLSLIATSEGLLVSSTSSEYDSETIAAIASLVGETASRAERHLGFLRTDEVSVVDRHNVRLVCHRFEVGEKTFILVLLVPYSKPYRRISSKALAEIRMCFKNKI
jgi:predicted regulator of Ras-like GTPase activity (Roadblock/LC7/MglB family)